MTEFNELTTACDRARAIIPQHTKLIDSILSETAEFIGDGFPTEVICDIAYMELDDLLNNQVSPAMVTLATRLNNM